MKYEDLTQDVELSLGRSTGESKQRRVAIEAAKKKASLNNGIPTSEEEFLLINPNANLVDLNNYRIQTEQLKQQKEYQQSLDDEALRRSTKPERSVGDAVKDFALNPLAQGAVATAQTAYGVAELFSKVNPIRQVYNAYARSADKKELPSLDGLTGFSEQFGYARKYWDDMLQSDASKHENVNIQKHIQEASATIDQEVQEKIDAGENYYWTHLKGMGEKAIEAGTAYLKNPAQILEEAGEEIPQLLLGGIAGKLALKGVVRASSKEAAERFLKTKAGKKAQAKAAKIGGVTNSAVTEASISAVDSRAEVQKMSHEQLLETSPYYKELLDSGLSEKEAKNKVADSVFNTVYGSTFLAAALISKYTGAGKLEGGIFNPKDRLKKVLGTVTSPATEALEEAAQGASGQFFQNVAKYKYADDTTKLGEGVGEAAGQGAVVGAAIGAGINVASKGPQATAEGTKTAAKALDKGLKTVARGAAAVTNTKEVKEAIKTGDLSKVTNVDSDTYNPRDALKASLHRDSVPTQAEGETKEVFKERNKTYLTDLYKHLGKLQEEALTTEDEVESERINKEVQLFKNKITPIKDLYIKDNFTNLNSALEDIKSEDTEVKAKAKETILGSMADMNLEGVSLEIAENLVKEGNLNEEEQLIADTFIEAHKTMEEVGDDIFQGSKGKLGIKDYISNFTTALQFKDKDGARSTLKLLNKFSKQHNRKLSILKQAQENYEATREDQKVVVPSTITDKEPTGYTVSGISTNLINTIETEANALQKLTQELTNKGVSVFGSKEQPKGDINGDANVRTDELTEATGSVEPDVDVRDNQSTGVPADISLDTEPTEGPRTRRNVPPTNQSDTEQSSPVGFTSEQQDTSLDDPELSFDADTKIRTGKNRSVVEGAVDNTKYRAVYDGEGNMSKLLVDTEGKGFNQEISVKTEQFPEPHIDNQLGPIKQAITQADLVTPTETVSQQQEGSTLDDESVSKQVKVEKQGQKDSESKTQQEAKPSKDGGKPTQLREKPSILVKRAAKGTINKFFKIKNKSPFNKTKDYLNELTVEEPLQTNLESIKNFKTSFTNSLDELVGLKTEAYVDQNPIQYLLEEGATNYSEGLTDNTLNAVILSVTDWVSTFDKESRAVDIKTIEKIYNVDSDEMFIPEEVYKFHRERGLPATDVFASIGSNVLNMLEFSSNKDGDMPISFRQRLAVSIGEATILSAAQSGLVSLKRDKGAFDYSKTAGFSFNPVKSFTHIKVNDDVNTQEVIKAYKSLKKVFSDGVSVDLSGGFPTLKPNDEVNLTDASKRLGRSKTQTDAVRKYNNRKYYLNGAYTNVMHALGDVFLTIGGFDASIKVDGTGIITSNEASKARLEGTNAKNNSLRNQLENFQEFITSLHESSDDVENTPFYFNNVKDGNQRTRITQKAVSPQANKMHRFGMIMEGWEYEVDSPYARNMFKLALAQAFGEKIEKFDDSVTLAKADEILDKNTTRGAIYHKAVQSLKWLVKNSDKGREDEVNQHRLNVLKAVKDGDEEYHSLAGLVALMNYKEDAPFTASLPLEIDGITNGTAIMIMQMPLPDNMRWQMLDILNRTGIFTEKFNSFAQWFNSSTKNVDNYDKLVSTMVTSIHEILTDKVNQKDLTYYKEAKTYDDSEKATFKRIGYILSKFKAKNYKTFGLTRGSGKSPVMQGNYAAGMKSLRGIVVKEVIDALIKDIELAVKANSTSKLTTLKNELDTILGIDSKLPTSPKKALNWELDETAKSTLSKAVDSTYGQVLQLSYKKEFGSFRKETDKLNKVLQIQDAIYRAAYNYEKDLILTKRREEIKGIVERNKKVKAAAKAANKEPKLLPVPTKEITIKEHEEILNKIKAHEPRLLHGSVDNVADRNTYTNLSDFSSDSENVTMVELPLKGADTKDKKGKRSDNIGLRTQKILSSQVNSNTFQPIGVRTAAIAAHGQDSAIADQALLLDEAILQVYDGFIVNPMDAEHAAENLNKSFFETAKNTNIYHQAVTDLQNSLKSLSGLSKDFIDSVELEVSNTLQRSTKKELSQKDKDMVKKSLKEVINHKEDNLSRKEALADSIIAVNQYGLNNGHHDVTATKQEAEKVGQEQLFKDMVSDLFDSVKKELKSSTNRVEVTTNESANFSNLESGNVEQLLEDVNSASHHKTSNNHLSNLTALLGKTFNNYINPIKLRVFEQANKNTAAFLFRKEVVNGREVPRSEIILNLSKKLANFSALELGGAELLAHETIHAITHTALEGSSKLKHEINSLWKQAGEHIKPEDLIPLGFSAKEAQSFWDYIFNNPDKTNGVSHGLHEFVAFGLTNENFMKLLQEKVPTKPEDNLNEGWLSRLENWFFELLDLFLGKFNRTTTADVKLKNLVLALMESEGKAQTLSGMQKLQDEVEGRINNGIRNIIVKPLVDFLDKDLFHKQTDSGILAFVQGSASVGRALLTGNIDQYRKVLNRTLYNLSLTEDNLITSLINEMAGQTKDLRIFYELSRVSNHLIQQTKLDVANRSKQYLLSKFHRSLTKAEDVGLTKILLKTDVASLLENFSAEEILDLLTDENKLNKEIEKHIKDLGKFNQDTNYYVSNAESLGHFMVTSRYLNDATLDNAHAIANLKGLAEDKQKPVNAKLAEPIIDRLATLHAIKFSKQLDAASYDTVLNLFNQENERNPNDNGVLALLVNHAEFKKDSQKMLFNNNPMAMSKGFIEEIYNPNKNIQVAPMNDRSLMEELGYRFVSAVPKQKNLDTNVSVGVFIRDIPETEAYQSGGLVLDSLKAKGTSYTNVALNSTTGSRTVNPTAATLDQVIAQKERLAQMVYAGKPNGTPENRLTSVLNESGKVANLNYVMSEEFKDSLLDRDLRMSNVFSKMESNLRVKVNADTVNKQHIDALIEDQAGIDRRNTEDYVLVGSNSPREDLREIWAMIPKPMKDRIKEKTGDNGLYVNRQVLKVVFGQRNFSISSWARERKELNIINRKTVNLLMKHIYQALGGKTFYSIEKAWQEIVRFVKDTIVIKSIDVLVNNVISNNFSLYMLGVPIKDIFKHQVEAIKLMRQHQADVKKVDTLEREIKLVRNKKGNTTSLEGTRDRLKERMKSNPLTDLIDAGMFQTLVEDVSLLQDEYSYKSKVENWLSSVTDKIPPVMKKVAQEPLLTQGSELYQLLRNATQFSDFASRYALHKHQLSKGKSKTESIDLISEAFVNYDLPSHWSIEYLNTVGGVMFTKYLFRIQKVLFRSLKENPARTLTLGLWQELFGAISTPWDSLIFFEDWGFRFKNPLEVLDSLDLHPLAQIMK